MKKTFFRIALHTFFVFRNLHTSPLKSKVTSEPPPHIKIFFNAQEAKPLPPLGPVIAMFQLSMASVCKDLNRASLDFVPGAELRALIFKNKNKTYNLTIRPPTLKFYLEQALLSQFSEEELQAFQEDEEAVPSAIPSTLPVEVLYDVFFIHFIFSFGGPSFDPAKNKSFISLQRFIAKQGFSTLSSMLGFIKKISNI